MHAWASDQVMHVATTCMFPRENSISDQINNNENVDFYLRWKNISHSYKSQVKKKSLDEGRISALQPCDGRAECATVTAILGPSGAGKSTLLDCLTGRVRATTGNCFIRTSDQMIQELRKSRVDYVPQGNEFMSLFSVHETLIFASRMNNIDWTEQEHRINIDKLLQALDMSDKRHWPLAKLSGGQMKRVAIACGVITRPAVIVLDEPTSGLDADNAERLICHLKSLVKSEHLHLKPAVILTIHSPSVAVFHMFDQVYILSKGGHNIFQGTPNNSIDHFKSFGFSHTRGNPADWCIDVANGKFGSEKFLRMAKMNRSTMDLDATDVGAIEVSSMKKTSAPTLLAIWLLTWRALVYYSTKVPQLEARMICHVMGLTTYFLAQKEHIIGESLCTEEGSSSNSSFLDETALVTMKLNMGLENQFTKMSTIAAFGASFISGVTYVSIVAAVMLVTLHRTIYHRELRNCWYSSKSFFCAKVASDSIIRLMATGVCGLLVHLNTRDEVEVWRIIMLTGYLFILSTIWENVAAVVAIFGEKSAMIQVMGWNLLFEVVDGTLIEFLAHRSVINSWVFYAKRFSPRSNAFRAMMISLYGFGRCHWSSSGEVARVSLTNNQTPKIIMSHLWRTINLTREKVVNLLDIYDVDEKEASGLYYSLDAWKSNQTQTYQRHPSKVLDFFDFDETDVFQETLILAMWTLATWILLGVAVRVKFARN